MRWQKKLTKSERHHLHCHTLREVKELREWQHKLDSTKEVCWDCRSIAIKLGLE